MTEFGTCKTCKWWESETAAWMMPSHPCAHPKLRNSEGDDGIEFDSPSLSPTVFTGPDFGCIHHEENS